MTIATIKEPGKETRIAITPHSAKNYIKMGFEVSIELNAGLNAGFSNEDYEKNGVKIIAPVNLPATMPTHASLLFSRNLTAFVQAFTQDKKFHLDLLDDIQKGSLITHNGEVLNSRIQEALLKETHTEGL